MGPAYVYDACMAFLAWGRRPFCFSRRKTFWVPMTMHRNEIIVGVAAFFLARSFFFGGKKCCDSVCEPTTSNVKKLNDKAVFETFQFSSDSLFDQICLVEFECLLSPDLDF